MTLREELAAEAKSSAGRRCLTCHWLDSQPLDKQPEWIDLMADQGISHAELYRFARLKGYSRSLGALRAHRLTTHP